METGDKWYPSGVSTGFSAFKHVSDMDSGSEAASASLGMTASRAVWMTGNEAAGTKCWSQSGRAGLKEELRYQHPYTNSLALHRGKWLWQKGKKLGKLSAHLQRQLSRSNYCHVHNLHRSFPMRMRRNWRGDYHLKIRTTLMIHKGHKNVRTTGLNKPSFCTTACSSFSPLLLPVTQQRLALGESSNKECVFWSTVSKLSLVPETL